MKMVIEVHTPLTHAPNRGVRTTLNAPCALSDIESDFRLGGKISIQFRAVESSQEPASFGPEKEMPADEIHALPPPPENVCALGFEM
jgi:hypothetical protein